MNRRHFLALAAAAPVAAALPAISAPVPSAIVADPMISAEYWQALRAAMWQAHQDLVIYGRCVVRHDADGLPHALHPFAPELGEPA